jgi:hypothetical protein
MELTENYSGNFNEEGYFVFDKFEFYGCCLLGEGVQPAIPQSTVEQLFSKQEFNKKFSKEITEYNHLFTKYFANQGGVQMTLEQLLAKYSVSVEQVQEKIENYTELSVEDLESKMSELFEVSEPIVEPVVKPVVEPVLEPSVDPVVEPEFTPVVEPVVEPIAEPILEPNANYTRTRNFELSHDDIRSNIYRKLDTYVESNNMGSAWDFWLKGVYDNYFIAQDEMNNKFYKFEYSKESTDVNLSSHVEVFAQYLLHEEVLALELMRSNFTAIEEENKSLKEFKAQIESKEHEFKANELFTSTRFSKLEEEDIKELKENVQNFSIQEIESKLFEVLGRKLAESQPTKEKPVNQLKFSYDLENVSKTNSYDHLFEKHGLKK